MGDSVVVIFAIKYLNSSYSGCVLYNNFIGCQFTIGSTINCLSLIIIAQPTSATWFSLSWSLIVHMSNVRRTKNSYETWGACVLSFRTSQYLPASQYPQHCLPETIQTAVKDMFIISSLISHVTFIDFVILYWMMSIVYFSLHQMTIVLYCLAVAVCGSSSRSTGQVGRLPGTAVPWFLRLSSW